MEDRSVGTKGFLVRFALLGGDVCAITSQRVGVLPFVVVLLGREVFLVNKSLAEKAFHLRPSS